MTFQFEVTFDVDEIAARAARGQQWIDAAQESAREFADELKAFIDRHPFIEAVSMKESTQPDDHARAVQ